MKKQKFLEELLTKELTTEQFTAWLTQWYLAAWRHKVLLLNFQSRLVRENHPTFALLGTIVADELGLNNPSQNHLILLSTYISGLQVNSRGLEYLKDAIPAVKEFAQDTYLGWFEKDCDFGIGVMRYFEEIGDDIHKAYLSAVKRYEKTRDRTGIDISYFMYHGNGAEEEHSSIILEAKKLCFNQDLEQEGYLFGESITNTLLQGLFEHVFR